MAHHAHHIVTTVERDGTLVLSFDGHEIVRRDPNPPTRKPIRRAAARSWRRLTGRAQTVSAWVSPAGLICEVAPFDRVAVVEPGDAGPA